MRDEKRGAGLGKIDCREWEADKQGGGDRIGSRFYMTIQTVRYVKMSRGELASWTYAKTEAVKRVGFGFWEAQRELFVDDRAGSRYHSNCR